jgi:glucose-6-phosphate 1-dehydrogenase
VPAPLDDAAAFGALGERLVALDAELGADGRRLFYCATPPSAFPVIVQRIGDAGLAGEAQIVFEKPIGHDLASAVELDRAVRDVFDESQVLRIDHYVGKEAVQNILVLRFANSMVERAWCAESVDHVQITVAESAGIEQRGRYYEEAGALRDMVQNHLLQVLAFVAMESPESLAPEDVRDRKAELLAAVRPFSVDEFVRGQYSAGVVEGNEAVGYRDEERVAPDSSVETFVALRAWIDNDRWKGVPFYLRAGKRLPRRTTEVAIVLRESAHRLFDEVTDGRLAPHHLALRIQPDEGISMVFRAKEPGPGMALDAVPMDFSYGGSFRTRSTEAYERLLYDAMAGDHTLFLREDAVERSWEIVAPVLGVSGPVHPYAAGTWGPSAAHELIAPHAWRSP